MNKKVVLEINVNDIYDAEKVGFNINDEFDKFIEDRESQELIIIKKYN